MKRAKTKSGPLERSTCVRRVQLEPRVRVELLNCQRRNLRTRVSTTGRFEPRAEIERLQLRGCCELEVVAIAEFPSWCTGIRERRSMIS